MKCYAALSVLALAFAATAAPVQDNHYDDRFENRGFETKGFESRGYEARGYDNGYYGRGRDYDHRGYGYGPGYGYGSGRQYKRAVQGQQQTGYGRDWAPYNRGGGYDGDYDASRSYEDNLNGNSRDNIGNSRDIVGNRGNTNGNTGDVCSAKTHQQVCCDGGLGCLVQLLGETCKNTAYCCNTSAGPGTAVNLALLNCLKIK
ncbi:hypothetical protein CP533_0014 [Ophiocordyceps camponoti-saundersi (nom. inval.)]|nr:hypothetical protein CP533_0014 [Ophiocordyceps camponoti-saundersi (nom. inval.)]